MDTRLILDRVIAYDGSQLSSRWVLKETGLNGDAAAAFIGPADVSGDALVDLEDRQRGDFIKSASMLHFIAEFFGPGLDTAVAYQRLLIAIIKDVLEELSGTRLTRSGDDLYDAAGRKLSVSIATSSPVSVLIHTGVNIDPAGSPVAAVGLLDLGIDQEAAGQAILDAFKDEIDGMRAARLKVRPVD